MATQYHFPAQCDLSEILGHGVVIVESDENYGLRARLTFSVDRPLQPLTLRVADGRTLTLHCPDGLQLTAYLLPVMVDGELRFATHTPSADELIRQERAEFAKCQGSPEGDVC